MIVSSLKRQYQYIAVRRINGYLESGLLDRNYRFWLEEYVGQQHQDWDWAVNVEYDIDDQNGSIELDHVLYFGFNDPKHLTLFELFRHHEF